MILSRSRVVERSRELHSVVRTFLKQMDQGPNREIYTQLFHDYGLGDCKLHWIVSNTLIPACVPYKKQLIVTPGNGTIATIESICYQLLTYPEELFVIPSARDELGLDFIRLLKEQGWPVSFSEVGDHEGKLESAAHFDPDLAILYGSDDTIREYEKQLSPYARVVKYGSKTSIGVHFVEDRRDLESYTELYASDFFKNGGVGCLNTSVLYLITQTRDRSVFNSWVSSLAEVRERYIPFPSQNSLATLQASMLRAGVDFSQDQGIILRDTTEHTGTIGIGNGTAVIVVCSFDDVLQEWDGRGHLLSSATLREGFGNNSDILFDLGVSRITRPGKAQSPSHKWRHDGLPIIPVWGREVGFDL